MITRIGLEQLLRIWDYLAFESDAEMPAVRLVADLIFDLLTGRKDVDVFDQLRRGIQITPVDRSRGYKQFKEREGN